MQIKDERIQPVQHMSHDRVHNSYNKKSYNAQNIQDKQLRDSENKYFNLYHTQNCLTFCFNDDRAL